MSELVLRKHAGRGPKDGYRIPARHREIKRGVEPSGLEVTVLEALRVQTKRWGDPVRGITTEAIATEAGALRTETIEALRGLAAKGHVAPWSRVNGSRTWRLT